MGLRLKQGTNNMRYRALVFDAEQPVRKLLATILERRGYEVFCYPTAFQCLKCRGDQCTDLIIADMALQGGSGLEFVKAQLAAGCQNENLALMAGSWNRADSEAARALGCQIFTKPFGRADLESWLDEVERTISPDRVLSDYYIDNSAIPCDEEV